MTLSAPMPLEAAVRRLDSKTPIATTLTSEQLQKLQVGVLDRAFFSARLNDIRIAAAMQAKIREALDLSSRDKGRAFMSRDRFIVEMRELLGAAPGDSGDITDFTSSRRLGLIYDINVQEAREYGRWLAEQSPAILLMWPCSELVRIEEREVPRGFRRGPGGALIEVPEESWPARWEAAGGKLYGGRMIAPKSDGVWERVNRFRRPWGPFDFGSGYGKIDTPRATAIELGVPLEPEAPAPETPASPETDASVPAAPDAPPPSAPGAAPAAPVPPSSPRPAPTPSPSAPLPRPPAAPGSRVPAPQQAAPSSPPAPATSAPGANQKFPDLDFNHRLEASVPDATPEMLAEFKKQFGDQVDVNREGKISWQGQRVARLYDQALKDRGNKWSVDLGIATPATIAAAAAAGVDLRESHLVITADDVRHIHARHGVIERDPAFRPVTAIDLQLIPHVWRSPDKIEPGDEPGTLLLTRVLLGEYVVVAFDRRGKSPRWGVRTFYTKKKGAP